MLLYETKGTIQHEMLNEEEITMGILTEILECEDMISCTDLSHHHIAAQSVHSVVYSAYLQML